MSSGPKPATCAVADRTPSADPDGSAASRRKPRGSIPPRQGLSKAETFTGRGPWTSSANAPRQVSLDSIDEDRVADASDKLGTLEGGTAEIAETLSVTLALEMGGADGQIAGNDCGVVGIVGAQGR